MLGIFLVVMALTKAGSQGDLPAEVQRALAAAVGSAIDPLAVDPDMGPSYVTHTPFAAGLIITVEPVRSTEAEFHAYAESCARANDFIDGNLLLHGEMPQQFIERNYEFFIRTNFGEYSRCMSEGTELISNSYASNGLHIFKSRTRIASFLLIWAEFLRQHGSDPDRWRSFLLAALEQEHVGLSAERYAENAALLASAMKFYDRSKRTTLLDVFEPRDELERTTLEKYLTLVVRVRQKLMIFYPDQQRELLKRDSARLDHLANAGAPR